MIVTDVFKKWITLNLPARLRLGQPSLLGGPYLAPLVQRAVAEATASIFQKPYMVDIRGLFFHDSTKEIQV